LIDKVACGGTVETLGHSVPEAEGTHGEDSIQSISKNRKRAHLSKPAQKNARHFLADGCDRVREYLEIGSFEGRSCLYAAKLFPKAHITCIDTFAGDEYTNPDNENLKAIFENLECRFLPNIAPIRERITVLKGTSLQRLSELSDRTESFDAIYIDGSHFYRHALLDTLISWPLLKVGGIMIWDDYIWDLPNYGVMKTKLAVDQFLSAYEGDYEILFVTNQVAIRKARSETRYFRE
jgi:predicted O-methyltransferase YrrM